jgi:hypothetical protein
MMPVERGAMIFQELHNRYGSHVARRVQQELTSTEFEKITLKELPTWLETRAEAAHRDYQARLDNPYLAETAADQVSALYQRWQGAEDLAYIITVAEDVGARARAVSGK